MNKTYAFCSRKRTMKNRYQIIKKLYPNYLILFLKKEKYISVGIDKKIIKYLKIKSFKKINNYKINYLILDNLEITYKQNFNEENIYQRTYLIVSLLEIINKIRKRVDEL